MSVKFSLVMLDLPERKSDGRFARKENNSAHFGDANVTVLLVLLIGLLHSGNYSVAYCNCSETLTR